MSLYCLVDVNCFKAVAATSPASTKSQLVVKELAVGDDEHYISFLFKPPPPNYYYQDFKTNKWVTRNLHGLQWCDGEFDYHYLIPALKLYTKSSRMIFAKGLEKCKLIERLIGRPVFDLDMINCPRINDLPIIITSRGGGTLDCGHHRYGLETSCVNYKFTSLMEWMKDNSDQFDNNNNLNY